MVKFHELSNMFRYEIGPDRPEPGTRKEDVRVGEGVGEGAGERTSAEKSRALDKRFFWFETVVFGPETSFSGLKWVFDIWDFRNRASPSRGLRFSSRLEAFGDEG